ncbi:HAMP domain-containing sensor histidine kinase [Exiguobacterium sp. s193]|uniref:HAMP domain-containing sensor histidine kinase n=1 Tax=Exiguobacterium sp. s193 TaxID=2751207 RepID=UPI001BE85009|nr:HAMP domain-containing sensor histidine kinase [Exiguobacterium sp. s193]
MRHLIKRQRITGKLFFLTMSLLIVAVLSTVVFLYATLPSYYQSYREDQFHSTMDAIAQESRQLSSENLLPLLDQLTAKGIRFSLWTEDDQLLYAPGFGRGPVRRTVNNSPEGMIQDSIPLQLTDRTVTLDADQMIQPIDEVKAVILKLAPYIVFPLLLLAGLAAYLYSRTISRPLLSINQATEELANLNFSVRTNHTSMDELGDLSRNINQLATKLKLTMDSLHTSNEQLRLEAEKDRQRDTERRQLFLAISHELKTPITIVKGQIEGMLLNLGVYRDRDRYLERAGQVIENMEQLISELLEVARIEQLELQLEETNPLALIRQQLHQFDQLIHDRNLHVTLPDEEWTVTTDRHLLERALHNLLMNAISYTAPGGMIQIKMTGVQDDGTLTITNTPTVNDSSDTAAWFHPLARAEQSRNRIHGGSGLGLYLVHQIMERLNLDATLTGTADAVQFTARFKSLS